MMKNDLLYNFVCLFKGSEIKRFIKRGGKIGNNCSLYKVHFDYGHDYLIEIGNNVMLSHCTILAHDASSVYSTGYTKLGKVKIGNNVFIGFGAIVLPNVSIGDNCIVGAGAIVTKNIPSNSVVAGNPARIICSFEEYDKKTKKIFSKKPKFTKKWKKMNENDINEMMKQIEDIGFTK